MTPPYGTRDGTFSDEAAAEFLRPIPRSHAHVHRAKLGNSAEPGRRAFRGVRVAPLDQVALGDDGRQSRRNS